LAWSSIVLVLVEGPLGRPSAPMSMTQFMADHWLLVCGVVATAVFLVYMGLCRGARDHAHAIPRKGGAVALGDCGSDSSSTISGLRSLASDDRLPRSARALPGSSGRWLSCSASASIAIGMLNLFGGGAGIVDDVLYGARVPTPVRPPPTTGSPLSVEESGVPQSVDGPGRIPKGACLDLENQRAWNLARDEAWNKKKETCGKRALLMNADPVKCISDHLTLTGACARVFGALIQCGLDHCKAPCAFGSSRPKCLVCGATKCEPQFIAASGITDMPMP